MEQRRTEISSGEIENQLRAADRIREYYASMGKKPVALVDTYGCQQNEADSEKFRGLLERMGCTFTDDESKADIIVVNTCAVREHAEMRILGNVGALSHTKKANKEQIIALCGCMVQAPGMAERIKKSYPYVAIVFGPQASWRFPEFLERYIQSKKRIFEVEDERGSIAEGLPQKRDGHIKAWLSVMYGCNNFCSYCIVPYVRGRERSRRPELILEEARALVKAGYKDITLLGQNVNSYGKDLDENIDFADLIKMINDIPGEFVIRFMTSHPKDASEKLFATMASCEKAAHQLHLPFQAGNDRVLKAMNRVYDSKTYLEKVELARRYMPDLVLTSDVIVGFPGETDEEFEDTIKLIEKVRFDALFTFIYSKRPGTPAAKMPDPYTRENKQRRFDRLLDAQNNISAEKHKEYVGKTFRVLTDGYNGEDTTARTGGGRLVRIAGKQDLGKFINVKITDSTTWALFGTVEEDMEYTVRLFRNGSFIKETKGTEGDTLLNVVTKAGEFLDAPCGGNGKCGKCLVQLTPNGEKVKACMTKLAGNTDIYLPDEMDEMKIADIGTGAMHDTGDAKGPYGVAIDIGTTTVVAHLTDLPTGKRIATASGVNEQRRFGADVISRIQYCAENGHEELTRVIRTQIAELINEDIAKAGISKDEIKYLSIAGNTIMEHLFAGDSPVGMGVVPFTPVSLYGDERPAGDDMPVAEDAVLYLAPCVSSYVGGDITAGMIACKLDCDEGATVYLDIGTNGEMGLKIKDKCIVCATAAGPAFEGAEITCGMAAVPGAVNHVRWSDGKLSYDVIGNGKPTGICGSGLLDSLAVMLDNEIVDETGRLLAKDELDGPITEYMGQREGKNVFWLNEENDVCVTSDDVRKLQLAKAAIAAGIQTMLRHAGIKEVKAFLLCGGFGSFMDQKSAARMGLFPTSFLPVAKTMGNTAGEGAAITVWSEKARERLNKFRDDCEYIELSDSLIFNEEFIEQMMFEE